MDQTNKKTKIDNSMVCTACSQRLDLTKPDGLRQHPTLSVLLCKRCFSLRTTKNIEVGDDGCDEACQWCALEGDLICCDFCSHAFCKLCIRRNLGRAHLNSLLNSDEDDKWKCYICAPSSLKSLVKMCSDVFQEFGISTDDPNLELNMDVENIEDENVEIDGNEVTEDGEDLVFLQTPSGDVIAVPADQAKRLIDGNNSGSEGPRSRGRPPSKMKDAFKEGNAAKMLKSKNMPITKPILKTKMSTPTSGPKIDEYNVWLVLEKLYASTQSMSLLLGSLKDDLQKCEDSVVREQQRQNVSNKLWRALLAFRRSFSEVANSCRLPLIGAGGGPAPKHARFDEMESDEDDEDGEDDEDYEEENMGILSS